SRSRSSSRATRMPEIDVSAMSARQDPMLAAQVGRFHPGLVLLQAGDDLLFGMPLALHRLVLSSGPDSSSPGSVQGGNVSKQKEFSDQIRSAILHLPDLPYRPAPAPA